MTRSQRGHREQQVGSRWQAGPGDWNQDMSNECMGHHVADGGRGQHMADGGRGQHMADGGKGQHMAGVGRGQHMASAGKG